MQCRHTTTSHLQHYKEKNICRHRACHTHSSHRKKCFRMPTYTHRQSNATMAEKKPQATSKQKQGQHTRKAITRRRRSNNNGLQETDLLRQLPRLRFHDFQQRAPGLDVPNHQGHVGGGLPRMRCHHRLPRASAGRRLLVVVVLVAQGTPAGSGTHGRDPHTTHTTTSHSTHG